MVTEYGNYSGQAAGGYGSYGASYGGTATGASTDYSQQQPAASYGQQPVSASLKYETEKYKKILIMI